MNYDNLVKALRFETDYVAIEKTMCDAAAAIEALQAELGKEGKRVEHLLAMVNELEDKMPELGEWELIDGAEPMRWGCSLCKYLSWETSTYCPRCGAKMEVQDGDEKGT